jgi:thiol-disulfide isomerase/thioredoxin
MRLAIAIFSAVIVTAAFFVMADEPKSEAPPAIELRADGVNQAKAEGKRVFLTFGSSGCGWCKIFDKYHADPEVARVVAKYFVFVKVSIDENPGGDKLYLEYGKQRGVPAFSILDSNGKVLADSGDEGQNIGFPFQPQEIASYFVALAKTCPALTDSEAMILRQKLSDVRPKTE